MKGQNNVNVPSDRCHIDMLYMHWIQCSVPLSPSRMCPDYLFMLSQRMCYAVYFREEIESGVTVVIYSLNDNLLAKSLSVIAKSPAWLVGGTAYPLEALMRWTKMQFGGGRDVGVAFSQRRVRLARHAINFSSEVSAVFLLRCVSKRENIYLVSVCFVSASPRAHACVCVCVFWDRVPTWCFFPVTRVCGNSSMCGSSSSACVAWTPCVCLRDGMGCMFTGLQSGAGWRPAETMGLENGVCLCVPLLSQREARQLSTLSLSLSLSLSLCRSLSPSLCLSRSLAGSVFSAQSLFFSFASSLRSVSLSSLSAPLVIFSPLSPLHAPAVLMFSRHVSYPSCFLCVRLSSCCFLFFPMLRGSSLFSHHWLPPFPSQTKCVSNWK